MTDKFKSSSSFTRHYIGYVDLDIGKYVSYLHHDLSRQTLNPI